MFVRYEPLAKSLEENADERPFPHEYQIQLILDWNYIWPPQSWEERVASGELYYSVATPLVWGVRYGR